MLRVIVMNIETSPRDPAVSSDDAALRSQRLKAPYAELVAGTSARTDDREIRGVRAHVRVYGDPAAPHRVVFLHGLRGDHHGLEPIVAHLVRNRRDVQVVVPDLPGYGASAPLPDAQHDVAGFAAWTTELLAAVAPDGDVILAGHSFGSIVAAAAAAADDARRVRALVLVNPIATAALDGPRRVLSAVTVGVHRLAAALPERVGTGLLRHPIFTRVASVAMVTTHDRALRGWIHAEHDRYFSGFADRRTLLETFYASVGTDVSGYAADIVVPTLLVASERDDVAPLPSQCVLEEKFSRGRLVVVPQVGHLAHYEAPDVVAGRTAEFLTALDETAS